MRGGGAHALSIEHLDVIVVGAGLSGIDAGYHLQSRLPGKTYAILESRSAIGGTWDLFRYPGIRSDSDMYTLGFPFRPWLGDDAIADGGSIRDYVRDTAREFGIDRHVRYRHKVLSADWSSTEARWTLQVECDGTASTLTCGFLHLCAGYYDYDKGHAPNFPGAGDLCRPDDPSAILAEGFRLHRQARRRDRQRCHGGDARPGARRTRRPRDHAAALAELCRPSRPAKDALAARLRKVLPEALAYRLVRWRNVLVGLFFYNYARKNPEAARRRILDLARKDLGSDFDLRTHFTPRYDPWDQRMCLVPDADLFRAMKREAAAIVTDEIETFTPGGLRLASGRELQADVVVTATGLELKLVGGISLALDGRDDRSGPMHELQGLDVFRRAEPRLRARLHQRLVDAEVRPDQRLGLPRPPPIWTGTATPPACRSAMLRWLSDR